MKTGHLTRWGTDQLTPSRGIEAAQRAQTESWLVTDSLTAMLVTIDYAWCSRSAHTRRFLGRYSKNPRQLHLSIVPQKPPFVDISAA